MLSVMHHDGGADHKTQIRSGERSKLQTKNVQLVKKIPGESTAENYVERQEIKGTIKKEIAEHKSELKQVKSSIEKKFKKVPITFAYIDKKYFKYCALFWLQETSIFLNKLTENDRMTIFQEILNTLAGLERLSQIPRSLKQLKYYTLLMKHYTLVNEEDEKTFVKRFKKECLEQIIAYNETAEKELMFLETFVNFLISYRRLQSVVAELQLNEFCRGFIPLDQLINNILMLKYDTYGENLIVLQGAAKSLRGNKYICLTGTFKDTISGYIKPVNVQELKRDDRLVLEVTGKNIALNEILSQVENMLLNNTNIEEVRFVGADILHIDANLKGSSWQGKNIVTYTNAIKVYGNVTWDVSGKDNNHIYIGNAGTAEDGHGKQGADGYAGESGGNVLILAEKIENVENFTIISNGGYGSKGQDGGDGADGEKGEGVSKVDFDKKFPPVAKFAGYQGSQTLAETVKNIKRDFQDIQIEWYSNSNSNIVYKEIFINAISNQGIELIFSYQPVNFSVLRQAFLLCRGSLGKPGGHGGEYGLGGQGGYSGEIIVRNRRSNDEFIIIKECHQGQHGDKGQGGLNGSQGKKGWDIGYMDYLVSTWFFTETWPIFFGTDESSELSLNFFKEYSTKRIYCPYRVHNGQRSIYAEMQSHKIEHKIYKKTDNQNKTRQHNYLQRHAQTARKRNISQIDILATYSYQHRSIEKDTLQKLRCDLESTKKQALEQTKQQALQAIEDQQKHENQIAKRRTIPHFSYKNEATYYTAETNNLQSTVQTQNVELLRMLLKESEVENHDEMQEIEEIIREEIAEHKSEIKEVKSSIEKKFKKVPIIIEDAFIDRKYLENCASFWLQETSNFLNKITEKERRTILKELFYSLSGMQDLSQISYSLKQLKYYTLLMKHYALVSEETEKTFVNRFKKVCLEQIIAYSETAEKELMFLEILINFLISFRGVQQIIADLQLKEFCCGYISFNQLLNNIQNLQYDTYGENLEGLQDAAKGLKENEDTFLAEQFKEIIGGYIKPVNVQELKRDDRLVLEVTGKNIALNEILSQVENMLLNNTNIEEVRFVGADILHIDANLKGSAWQGKNIVTYTNAIKVYGNVTWDVSGKDNNHIYIGNAGTAEDGHGKQGADGYAGESGGNVLILVEKMGNPEGFTIISNGGNGSKGQDGGQGANGEDGIGISKVDFDKNYPLSAKYFNYSAKVNLIETCKSIQKNFEIIKTEWYGTDDTYVNAISNQGIEIIFSFQKGSGMTIRQAYLLCKGSLGKPGGYGGEYGLGGQGGYAGEIIVRNLRNNNEFNVKKDFYHGKFGDKGQGGLYGRQGKNGWDIGYMDCAYSIYLLTESWPKIFGTDEKSTLLNLRCDLENTKRQALESTKQLALQAITENQQQQENQTANLKTKYHSSCRNETKQYNNISIATSSTNYSEQTTDVDSLIEKLIKEPLNSWLQLKGKVLSFSQLDKLFSTFEHLFNNPAEKSYVHSKTDLQRVKKLLTDKYKFVTLQKIAKQLPVYQETKDNINPTAETASRFLIKTKQIESGIFHATLGTLDQYFTINNSKQREQISNYMNEDVENTEHDALLYSIQAFVLEAEKLEEAHTDIKKYYNEHIEFTEKQKHSLKIFAEVFYTELFQPRHEHILNLLIDSTEDNSLSNELYKEIEKDKFLKVLHDRFNNQKKLQYDWEKCCKDSAIRKKHNDYMLEKGPLSECYRELLAHIFDTNIRFYAEDQENKLLLQGDHNPSSEKVFYILCRNKKFAQLEIDQNNLQLEKERRQRDTLYAQILTKTLNFERKRDFDDYSEHQVFLFKNEPLAEKQSFDDEKNGILKFILEDKTQVLNSKYKHTSLSVNAKQLPVYQETTDDAELTAKCSSRYLFESKPIDNVISHPILGTLNHYFCTNSKAHREQISIFLNEHMLNTENESLMHSIKLFIYEHWELETAHTDIKKYYDEYKKFTEAKEHSLNIFLQAFYRELSQSRHVDSFNLWRYSSTNHSLKIKSKENIQKDKFLNALYDRLKNQYKHEYDWNKCWKDPCIIKEYRHYIKENDILSESYRELLACIFGIHIKLYVEDQENKLILQSDHNPLSEKVLHMVFTNNQFQQLQMNENNYIHASMSAVNLFKQKVEFDDYLENIFFSSYNELSAEEQSFDDKQNVKEILKYFSEEEILELEKPLEKITSEYIGQQDILHNILERFSIEGRHVSSQELRYLVNSILTIFNQDREEMNTFCWILVAYPQNRWIDETVLLALEDYFRKPLAQKTEWREFLLKIKNKALLLLFLVKLNNNKMTKPVSVKCIHETFRLLSYISNETVSLEGLELSEWPYALKEKYWTCKLAKLVNWREGHLPTASYYHLSIENVYGVSIAEELIEALETKQLELSSDQLTEILSNFHNKAWNLGKEELNTLKGCNVDEWTQIMQNKFTASNEERKITQLVELIKGNANTSEDVLRTLQEIKNCIENIDTFTISGKSVGKYTKGDIQSWVEKFIWNKCFYNYEEMLAVIERAIVLMRGIHLRDTQKLTVLTLLTNGRSTLAQVSTGEGKSLIVVAISIIKALSKEKVDIVTSSSVLAKRDCEEYRDIYNLFGVNVSHNCSEDIEKRKEAYAGNQVIYGDLSNFQRDHLLDTFYGKNILGARSFQNVIVDEVDSMLLDKGNNMLYLSHDLAGLDKLESVYVYIWQWINRPVKDPEDIAYAFDVKAIKEAVLNDLYGVIMKEDLIKLNSELNEHNRSVIWLSLVKAHILDDQGKMLKENLTDIELSEALPSQLSCYRDRIYYLLQQECIEREKVIHVPNYLRPFIEQHLESWIENAKTAFCMKSGEDYVVDVDKTALSPDRNPNITILDRDTGTDQVNSQWDEALHQFLQLKHGCKLSLQSLKAVFISNVSFLKLYRHLYGLTGTLGSHRERDLLREIHEVDYVIIPTARIKQFQEEKPILCSDKKDWIGNICNEAKTLTEKKKRSILIICETVNDVETLYKAFGGKIATHVHTYTRDYEEFDKGFTTVQGAKVLDQGQILIATNLAGRGTDIKITEQLRKAGGLHVCLSYLPNNARIEQQAFGRAARSGDAGSGQLIIMGSQGQQYSNSKVLDLKRERDTEELHRISDIKAYYETQITIEESCFKSFKKQYEKLKKKLDNKEVLTDVKQILLQSCLDKWAFWLDEHSKYVKHLKDEQDKRNLYSLLDKFIARLKDLNAVNSKNLCFLRKGHPTYVVEHDSTSWLAWVKGSPVQMIKLGKYLAQNREHKNALGNAVQLFNEVIQKEPCFSEAARYYKAYALLKQIDLEQKPLKQDDKKALTELKQELREAARLFDENSTFAISAAGVIGKIKKHNPESIIQIDAYEEQQKSLVNLYHIMLRSIDDIFGHPISPQTFVNTDIKEGLAYVLYEDLHREGILKPPKVRKNISVKALEGISSGFAISVQELKNFILKYRGKEINEKEFQKALKNAISLPSREAFWKLLIQEQVLSKELKYVVVDEKRLTEIDSLTFDNLTNKINERKLQKQTMEFDKEQIFLYTELLTQQKSNEYIFKKDDFVKIVGQDTYQVLKGRGVLSFNKKAHISKEKIKAASFTQYDSVNLDDLIKANITTSEAEKVLAELVQQDVVEKKSNSESSFYILKITFDEIELVKLSSCPVYENVVKGILTSCFTYRIALQKIEVQLVDGQEKQVAEKQENTPLRLPLMTKPHRNLVSELLDQKLIKPVSVKTEAVDFEEKLKGLYNRTMTKENLKRILSKRKLVPKEFVENLFALLIEKNWITEFDPIQTIQDEGIKAIDKSNLKNTTTSVFLVEQLYYISSPDKRQKPLSFSHKLSYNSFEPNTFDKTVEKVLDNQLALANDSAIQFIVNTLKRSRSSLKGLKVADANLKPLTELCDFGNIEEVHLFSLNGLDQLLQLEEKKWTREMLLNIAVVVTLGVVQISIGTLIELYSAGVMTHVGAAFVSEGVSDLFYAVGALKSGYFSWSDYRKQKLESLMFTVATVGLGAFRSKGTMVSRFGHKLAGPNFEFGKKVMEMSGKELIKTAGLKVVGTEVVKHISLKVLEGVAFGLANAGIDMLVENYLRGLCEGIASTILSDIEQEVEKHKVSANLQKVYDTLGEEEARKMVNDLTQSLFTEQNLVDKFLPITSQIVGSVTQGVAAAAKKTGMANSKSKSRIQIISTTAVWTERSIHLINMKMATSSFLDNFNEQLNSKLANHTKLNTLDQNQKEGKDYERFKKELVDQWKHQLSEQAGRVVSQHIVSPILKQASNHLIRFIGKNVQKAYRSCKESMYRKRFDELKQEYEEAKRENKKSSNTSSTDMQITEKYHSDLLELMKKTRNPKLFADIIRENVPMDLTCVNACILVSQSVLIEKGIEFSELTVCVEGDGGVKQRFSSESTGEQNINITLKLKRGHFELCSNSAPENNTQNDYTNNYSNDCLYETFAGAIPELKDVPAEAFRELVARCIEHDKTIQNHIRNGLHRLPASLDAVGGRKRKHTELINADAENRDEVIKAPVHMVRRAEHYMRIGPMSQRIHEETGIPRNKIFKAGPSEFQDRNYHGQDAQAGHKCVGGVYDRLKKHGNAYREAGNYLGDTDYVKKRANAYHKFPGRIDNLQNEYLPLFVETDWSSPNEKAYNTAKMFRDDFAACAKEQIIKNYSIFNESMSKKNSKQAFKGQFFAETSELIEISRKIRNMSIDSMVRIANKAYIENDEYRFPNKKRKN